MWPSHRDATPSFLFGHVRRLPEDTPAHAALKLSVNATPGWWTCCPLQEPDGRFCRGVLPSWCVIQDQGAPQGQTKSMKSFRTASHYGYGGYTTEVLSEKCALATGRCTLTLCQKCCASFRAQPLHQISLPLCASDEQAQGWTSRCIPTIWRRVISFQKKWSPLDWSVRRSYHRKGPDEGRPAVAWREGEAYDEVY